MSKLPSVSSEKIIRRLLKAGFEYAPIKLKVKAVIPFWSELEAMVKNILSLFRKETLYQKVL